MRGLAGRRLVVATHNPGKLAELLSLLSPFAVALESAADHGLAEPAETAGTFEGNARIKARHAAAATGLASLADDSGLEVDALGGAPGVHSADWAETPHGRDFGVAMQQVYEKLDDSGQVQPWGARFRCVFVLAWPDAAEEAVFTGDVAGHIAWPPRGSGGHGYDPIFQPEGHAVSFAEMSAEAKNALSHRAVAACRLLRALED